MGHHVWNDRKGRVEYEPDIFERLGAEFGSMFGGGMDIFSNIVGMGLKLVFILLGVGIAGYLVYILAADMLLGQIGLVKAKTPITAQVPQSIRAQPQSIMTVSHNKSPKAELFELQNGQAELKTRTCWQSFYLSYDHMLADSGATFLPSIVEPFEITGIFDTERALIITFADDHHTAISAENVTVRCSAANKVQGTVMDDGRLVLLLPEDTSSLTFTFLADGYEDTEVSMDWNQFRLGELEVCLHEK